MLSHFIYQRLLCPKASELKYFGWAVHPALCNHHYFPLKALFGDIQGDICLSAFFTLAMFGPSPAPS